MAWPKAIALDAEALEDMQVMWRKVGRYLRLEYTKTGNHLTLEMLETAKKGEGLAWEMRARHLPGGKFYEEEDATKNG